ncbi:MAG: ABC transporter ATP-binding protein [Deltaproteobacteria bacterium]|nr:MAG: ABC transporter ATP-binding protein [Deltaproteobacteria bacterium]
MSAVAALAVTRLCKSFGGLRALQQIDLSLAPGERHAIIGPNGAGKTTLFNLIAGELAPTAGRIALFGQDVTRLPPQRRAALGLARTFQVNTLFPSLTVTENLLLAVQGTLPTKLRLHRPISSYRDLYDRARAVLESVGLVGAGEVIVRTLSHGEQRQLEVALALASRPRLLLLDEPTAGLSLAESQRLTGLLKGLDRSMSLLVIEHDMDVVFDVAERITVLHDGKVIADGDRDEVRANPLVAEIYLGTG